MLSLYLIATFRDHLIIFVFTSFLCFLTLPCNFKHVIFFRFLINYDRRLSYFLYFLRLNTLSECLIVRFNNIILPSQFTAKCSILPRFTFVSSTQTIQVRYWSHQNFRLRLVYEYTKMNGKSLRCGPITECKQRLNLDHQS